MKKNTSQLDLFRAELAKLPDNVPTKPVWSSLHHVLTDYNEKIDELNTAVRGDGNGEKGLLRRMQIVEDSVKVIQSDVRETLNMMREMSSGAWEDDEEKEPEPDAVRAHKYFVDKILPGLLQAAIIAFVTALLVLIISHSVVP